jgi:thiamine pyrophosphokinase
MYIVIIANAPMLDITPYQAAIDAADYVIAADGGALPLYHAGRLPDLVIGDMDSLDLKAQEALAVRGVELRRYAREKDETDLELALLHAAALGAASIDVLGALGGRWDHTLANVALLALPELQGRATRLLADRQIVFLVRDSAVLEGQRGDTISLIPLAGAAYGVTTEGLYYPLREATLGFERARGVSNVLLEPPGRVSLRAGLLLVVRHDDGGAYQWQAGGDGDRR